MGMYDNICDATVVCPRCGDNEPKTVQIKCGPQNLDSYTFGKDKIDINWDYTYYGSIIDKDKGIIRGIATCGHCREESSKKMEELISEARKKGEIKAPEGAKFLMECEIDGENALSVMLNRLGDAYNGNRDIEIFEVAIFLKDNTPIAADAIVDLENRK